MIMPRRSPPSYGVEGPMVAKHVTLFDLPPDDRQSSRSTQPGGKIPVGMLLCLIFSNQPILECEYMHMQMPADTCSLKTAAMLCRTSCVLQCWPWVLTSLVCT